MRTRLGAPACARACPSFSGRSAPAPLPAQTIQSATEASPTVWRRSRLPAAGAAAHLTSGPPPSALPGGSELSGEPRAAGFLKGWFAISACAWTAGTPTSRHLPRAAVFLGAPPWACPPSGSAASALAHAGLHIR